MSKPSAWPLRPCPCEHPRPSKQLPGHHLASFLSKQKCPPRGQNTGAAEQELPQPQLQEGGPQSLPRAPSCLGKPACQRKALLPSAPLLLPSPSQAPLRNCLSCNQASAAPPTERTGTSAPRVTARRHVTHMPSALVERPFLLSCRFSCPGFPPTSRSSCWLSVPCGPLNVAVPQDPVLPYSLSQHQGFLASGLWAGVQLG